VLLLRVEKYAFPSRERSQILCRGTAFRQVYFREACGAAGTHLKRKSWKNVFPPVKAPHLRRNLFFIESYFFVRNTLRPLSERKFFKRKQITPVIKK